MTLDLHQRWLWDGIFWGSPIPQPHPGENSHFYFGLDLKMGISIGDSESPKIPSEKSLKNLQSQGWGFWIFEAEKGPRDWGFF